MELNLWQKFEAGVANFLPGWKTISLAGLLGGVNLLDWLQMNYQTFGGLFELIPEPYKTIMNVVVPALIMWVKNIKDRTVEVATN